MELLQPPRGQQMEGRRRVRAIDRDDIHPRQHHVERIQIGRAQLLLDRRRDAAAVVIVDRQPERLGAAGHRLPDAAHADDAEPLAGDAAPEHPGRRPALPAPVRRALRALDQPARHGDDQRHGHVGGVLGEHARRVGDGDAATKRRGDVDIVDAIAEIGDQLQVVAGLGDHVGVDPVGDGRHQHVGVLHRLDQSRPGSSAVVEIEARVEQLAHPGLPPLPAVCG